MRYASNIKGQTRTERRRLNRSDQVCPCTIYIDLISSIVGLFLFPSTNHSQLKDDNAVFKALKSERFLHF